MCTYETFEAFEKNGIAPQIAPEIAKVLYLAAQAEQLARRVVDNINADCCYESDTNDAICSACAKIALAQEVFRHAFPDREGDLYFVGGAALERATKMVHTVRYYFNIMTVISECCTHPKKDEVPMQRWVERQTKSYRMLCRKIARKYDGFGQKVWTREAVEAEQRRELEREQEREQERERERQEREREDMRWAAMTPEERQDHIEDEIARIDRVLEMC